MGEKRMVWEEKVALRELVEFCKEGGDDIFSIENIGKKSDCGVITGVDIHYIQKDSQGVEDNLVYILNAGMEEEIKVNNKEFKRTQQGNSTLEKLLELGVYTDDVKKFIDGKSFKIPFKPYTIIDEYNTKTARKVYKQVLCAKVKYDKEKGYYTQALILKSEKGHGISKTANIAVEIDKYLKDFQCKDLKVSDRCKEAIDMLDCGYIRPVEIVVDDKTSIILSHKVVILSNTEGKFISSYRDSSELLGKELYTQAKDLIIDGMKHMRFIAPYGFGVETNKVNLKRKRGRKKANQEEEVTEEKVGE